MLDFIYVLLVASCFAFVGVLLAYLRILGAFTFLLGWVASLPIWHYFNPPEVIDLPEIRISSILHLAADKFLVDNEYINHMDFDNDESLNAYADISAFSAVGHICKLHGTDIESENNISSEIYKFMLDLGYNYVAEGNRDTSSDDPQGDRYIFLKFAAMVAEDEEINSK